MHAWARCSFGPNFELRLSEGYGPTASESGRRDNSCEGWLSSPLVVAHVR